MRPSNASFCSVYNVSIFGKQTFLQCFNHHQLVNGFDRWQFVVNPSGISQSHFALWGQRLLHFALAVRAVLAREQTLCLGKGWKGEKRLRACRQTFETVVPRHPLCNRSWCKLLLARTLTVDRFDLHPFFGGQVGLRPRFSRLAASPLSARAGVHCPH